MQLIRGMHTISKKKSACVATIGNFDGVHQGHSKILQLLNRTAKHYQLPTVVIIFEPFPQEYFQQYKFLGRISSLRDKLFLLEGRGIDQILCLNFNKHCSQMTADTFIHSVLVQALKIRHLIIGDDFRFGYDRKGDYHHLLSVGKKLGFTVTNTKTISLSNNSHDNNAKRISSTLIREALSKGAVQLAEKYLGHPVTISGRVISGAQRGRTLGFPTANILIKNRFALQQGVYAVWVDDGQVLSPGVANLGLRPTIQGKTYSLEVHILDYNQNIYGRILRIAFLKQLRKEKKFNSLTHLKSAIQQDIVQAKSILNNASRHLYNIFSSHTQVEDDHDRL